MSYLEKYLKYKNKYLEFKNKNLIGGVLNKRIKKEIGLFTPDLYKNIINTEDSLSITCTRISDDAKINITFPIDYPFKSPDIKINGTKIDTNNWKPTLQIMNYLKPVVLEAPVDIPYNKNVLIFCHNKKVTGTFEPLTLNNHWYGLPAFDLFNKLFSEYELKGIPKFDTIDIEEGGTIIGDGFNNMFIDSHANKYDIVMIPDCGGPWEVLQSSKLQEEQNTKIEALINLCINLTKLLKPFGIIQFGKFINEKPCTIHGREFNNFCEALKHYLEINGFTVKINTYVGTKEILVARKND